ncbi:hypothetical protein B5F34_06540 [Mediterranea sp. An20]|uniref:hypothetical protein n=1 Tax=Mediterranea sp. An20 TaxID=1965586 RepID=UPI000B39FCE5|nr:hypothetical protein [Mediterranea sp. An20]OUP09704.1 hypothetical protein B5F34_06540 [Mediterranea sp. An20]
MKKEDSAEKASRPYQMPTENPTPDVAGEEAVLYQAQSIQPQSRYRRPPCQYTVEELKGVVAQAETEVDIDSEELHAYFKEKYPFLCL